MKKKVYLMTLITIIFSLFNSSCVHEESISDDVNNIQENTDRLSYDDQRITYEYKLTELLGINEEDRYELFISPSGVQLNGLNPEIIYDLLSVIGTRQRYIPLEHSCGSTGAIKVIDKT